MNAIRKVHVKRTAAVATTLILVTAPISIPKNMQLPGFGTHEVQAATLAEVNLLTDVNVRADVSNIVGEGPYNLGLSLTGQGVADVGVLNPEKVAVFYAPELAGKMQEDGPADVRVEILPITMDDVPALGTAVGGLTGTVTDLTTGLVSGIDEVILLTHLSELVEIEGLTELRSEEHTSELKSRDHI